MYDESVKKYIGDVMRKAKLSMRDKARTHAELWDHIQSWLEQEREFTSTTYSEQEIQIMLEQEFGKPEELGNQIASAKGKWLTHWKQKRVRIPVSIMIALMLGIGIKGFAIESFHIASNKLEPVINKGERVFVNKLVRSYSPNDIVIYKMDDREMPYRTGIVSEFEMEHGTVKVNQNNAEPIWVQRGDIVGKVIVQFR